MKRLSFLLFISSICFCARAQIITTIAGGSTGPIAGDGGPATVASIRLPTAGSFDSHGNYYFTANGGASVVRKISPDGVITRVAGNGTHGYSGDGGPATAASIIFAWAVADESGNVYIPDRENHRVRKVDVATGIINTIAGNGFGGHSGDGGPATNATMSPVGICVDRTGNIYVNDSGAWIRKISTSGIITNFAGNGNVGFAGDGGPATSADIGATLGLCVDSTGNVFFGCYLGHIRKVDASTGIISTVAGNGVTTPYLGDGMPATAAQFYPYTIGMDKQGNIYINDYGVGNERILKIGTDGIINSIAGNGTDGFSGDGGPATAAQIYHPEGVAVDSCGNVYIADDANFRIRKVTFDNCLPLAGDQKLMNACIKVYPNPAVDYVYVDNIRGRFTYRLLNSMGAAVSEGVLRSARDALDVRYLPKGLYFLVLQDHNGNPEITKLVKQ